MKLVINIVLILTIILTLGLIGAKPKMHPKIQIYDYNLTIVPKEETVITPVTSQKPIEYIEKKKISKPVNVVVKTVTKTTKQRPVKIQKKEVPKVKTIQKEITVHKPQNEIGVEKEIKQVSIKTEQEELIAWNKWHSNIQNSLMRDVKMPFLPNGTAFIFSFTVDKWGKITNIKTYSDNPQYTPYAIEYIAPVIRSYQGKDILNFPSGSKRETNRFEGGWTLTEHEAKYSQPSDYKDVERIKK